MHSKSIRHFIRASNTENSQEGLREENERRMALACRPLVTQPLYLQLMEELPYAGRLSQWPSSTRSCSPYCTFFASALGDVLVHISSRISTTGLLLILSHVYRRDYKLVLLLLELDIASHWLRVYCEIMTKSSECRHLEKYQNFLYSHPIFRLFCSLSQEVMYISLYLVSFEWSQIRLATAMCLHFDSVPNCHDKVKAAVPEPEPVHVHAHAHVHAPVCAATPPPRRRRRRSASCARNRSRSRLKFDVDCDEDVAVVI